MATVTIAILMYLFLTSKTKKSKASQEDVTMIKSSVFDQDGMM